MAERRHNLFVLVVGFLKIATKFAEFSLTTFVQFDLG